MEKRIKIIHFADVHLGRSFNETVKNLTDNRKKLREHLRKSFKKAVEICLERKPDIVVIAGDLFDVSRPLSRDSELVYSEISNAARSLPDTHFFLIPGGHDHLSPLSPYARSPVKDLASLPNVYVADSSVPNKKEIALKSGVLVALHYFPHEVESRDVSPLAGLVPVSEADFNIAVAHGSVVELLPPDAPRRDPISIAEMKAFDYTVLGDWHGYKEVYDEAGNIIGAYSGALDYLDLDEFKKRDRRGIVEAIITKTAEDRSIRLELIELEKISYEKMHCSSVSEFSKKISELDKNRKWFIHAIFSELEGQIEKVYEEASSHENIIEVRADLQRRISPISEGEYDEMDIRGYVIAEIKNLIKEYAGSADYDEEQIQKIADLAFDYAKRALEGEKPDDDDYS
jgi:DNA repair exonuclease SbcCD nuclease subunit